jgi:hypothetical protein
MIDRNKLSCWLPDTKPTLRQLEIVAIVATVLDLAITTASRGYLVEANPVAAAIVDAGGWPVVGAAGVLAVAGAFAVLRRVREQDRRLAWVGGVALATASAGAVAWGAWLVWQAGLPPSWAWGLRAVGPAVVVATAVVARLWTKAPLPRRETVARVAVAGLVAGSAITGILAIPQTTGVGVAQSGGVVFEDFEGGSNIFGATFNNSVAYEGSKSMTMDGDKSATITADSYDQVTFFVKPGGSAGGAITWQSGSTDVVEALSFYSLEFRYFPGGTRTTISNADKGHWYRITYTLDYSTNTFDLEIVDTTDGQTDFTATDKSFSNPASEISQIEILHTGGTHNLDYFTANGAATAPDGYTASGTVTNTSGDPLTDATVSVYNPSSTSIAGETTTNTSGEYNLTLANGTYTFQFAEAGYAATTKSVSVAGPTTVDAQLTTLANTTDTDVADSDGDGTPDASDPDDDDDGIPDTDDLDDDGDGIPDDKEHVVKGQVIDKKDSVPIADATVRFEHNGTTITATTDGVGDYRLRTGTQVYNASAVAPGYAAVNDTVNVSSNTTVNFELVAGSKGPPTLQNVTTSDPNTYKGDHDFDGDGIPNPLDSDVDGDGKPRGSDLDYDNDGLNNNRDPDDDNDGVPDTIDQDGIPDPAVGTAGGPYYANENRTVYVAGNVTDPDGGDVEVGVYLVNETGRLTLRDNVTVPSGGGYNFSLDARPGVNYWQLVAIDANGSKTTSQQYQFRTANLIYVRNASNTSQLVTANVTASFDARTGGTGPRRTVSDGTINMTGLRDTTYDVEIGAPGYENRSVIVDSPANRLDVTLVPNETTDPSIDGFRQCFTLTDKTGGKYPPANSSVVLMEPFGSAYTDVAGERFGAENKACLAVQDGESYRLAVVNDRGDRREVGSYVADKALENETIELVVEARDLGIPEDKSYSFTAYAQRRSEVPPLGDIIAQIRTNGIRFTNLHVQIWERRNRSNELADLTRKDVSSFSTNQTLLKGELNKTWVVNFTATTTEGRFLTGQRIVSATGRTVNFGLSDEWRRAASGGLLLFVGGLTGPLGAVVGAIVVSGVAGLLYLAGWFGPGGGLILWAISVSTTLFVARRLQ